MHSISGRGEADKNIQRIFLEHSLNVPQPTSAIITTHIRTCKYTMIGPRFYNRRNYPKVWNKSKAARGRARYVSLSRRLSRMQDNRIARAKQQSIRYRQFLSRGRYNPGRINSLMAKTFPNYNGYKGAMYNDRLTHAQHAVRNRKIAAAVIRAAARRKIMRTRKQKAYNMLALSRALPAPLARRVIAYAPNYKLGHQVHLPANFTIPKSKKRRYR